MLVVLMLMESFPNALEILVYFRRSHVNIDLYYPKWKTYHNFLLCFQIFFRCFTDSVFSNAINLEPLLIHHKHITEVLLGLTFFPCLFCTAYFFPNSYGKQVIVLKRIGNDMIKLWLHYFSWPTYSSMLSHCCLWSSRFLKRCKACKTCLIRDYYFSTGLFSEFQDILARLDSICQTLSGGNL